VEHPQESTVPLTAEELRSHPLIYAALRLREEYKVIHRAQRLSPILRIRPTRRRRTAHQTSRHRHARTSGPSSPQSIPRVATTYHGPSRPHIDASPPTAISTTTTASSDNDSVMDFDHNEFTRIRQERRRQQELLTSSEEMEDDSPHPQVIRNIRSVVSAHFYVVRYSSYPILCKILIPLIASRFCGHINRGGTPSHKERYLDSSYPCQLARERRRDQTEVSLPAHARYSGKY
jgi:hypothetical protein